MSAAPFLGDPWVERVWPTAGSDLGLQGLEGLEGLAQVHHDRPLATSAAPGVECKAPMASIATRRKAISRCGSGQRARKAASRVCSCWA